MIGAVLVLVAGSAYAQAPPGSLWACEADETSGDLYRLDPVDGSVISQVTMTTGGVDVTDCTGLAFHPHTQVLYALLDDDAPGERVLATVDPDSGVATVIGGAGGGDGDYYIELAFDRDGTLYTVGGCNCSSCDDNTIYTIDTTSALTSVFTTDTDNSSGPISFGYNAQEDTFYYVGGSTLVIDRSGASTEISTSTTLDQGIAWDPTQSLFLATDDSGIWTLTTAGVETEFTGSSIATSDTRGFAVAGTILTAPTLGAWGFLALVGLISVVAVMRLRGSVA